MLYRVLSKVHLCKPFSVQVRISYIDLLNPNKDRREELHSLYYFWCNCERCKQADLMAEAAACPNSSCTSPCLIENDKCEKCGVKLSDDLKKSFYEVTDFTAHHLEKMKTMACILTNMKMFFFFFFLWKLTKQTHCCVCNLIAVFDLINDNRSGR